MLTSARENVDKGNFWHNIDCRRMHGIGCQENTSFSLVTLSCSENKNDYYGIKFVQGFRFCFDFISSFIYGPPLIAIYLFLFTPSLYLQQYQH